jgi:predicted XRE-type DNA-binding protein
MFVTFTTMNTTLDAAMPDAVGAARADEARQMEREQARRELAEMSEAMVNEKGLLNHAQAALLLGVSLKRISELVRLGKLTRFDFLGRTYVSVREVRERYQQELKAGRPKLGLAERALASVKAALKTDAAQAKLGGYAGPYEKAKRKKKK